MRGFFFLRTKKMVFKNTVVEKISLLWLSDISCLFISLCQSLKNKELKQTFLIRQKEELGVSLVGDPNVMSEALGLKLSHWHGVGVRAFCPAFKARKCTWGHSYTHLLTAASASIVSIWDIAEGGSAAAFSFFKMNLLQVRWNGVLFFSNLKKLESTRSCRIIQRIPVSSLPGFPQR
jgi:hypothetical protein